MTNGKHYNKGYYLADGIYSEWSTFVKTIPLSQGEKIKLFSRCKGTVHKDVERAFGVLQSHFANVRGPTILCMHALSYPTLLSRMKEAYIT